MPANGCTEATRLRSKCSISAYSCQDEMLPYASTDMEHLLRPDNKCACLSFHSLCRPPLMRSFMRSYEDATLLKTWPTRSAFSSSLTS